MVWCVEIRNSEFIFGKILKPDTKCNGKTSGVTTMSFGLSIMEK